MIRIETASDLRRAWQKVLGNITRDLAFAARLAADPIGTFKELGYEVSPEAAQTLRRALP